MNQMHIYNDNEVVTEDERLINFFNRWEVSLETNFCLKLVTSRPQEPGVT